MVDNPFKYGVVVSGDDFVDRKEELDILYNEMSSGKSIILYSQRRLGKTSLLMEFMMRKAKNFIPVYIDLYGMTKKEDLANTIVNNVINVSYSKLEKIKDAAKDFLGHINPKLIISPDGKVILDISSKKSFKEEELGEIFDFPQKVAFEKKKKIVMIFDEFQEIAMLNGLHIEKLMRSRIQHHKDVSYVFAGSKEHLLQQMFEEKTRAFYGFARPLSLGMIPIVEFMEFIIRKFGDTGGNPSEDVVKEILNYTGGHPYFTQYLCHEIWYITRSPKKKEVLESAIEKIISHQSISYEHIWDELKSRYQRALLIGVASEGEPNYSSDFIQTYGLKSQSHVRKSIQMLKNRGILDDEGKIPDIFFKEWIQRRMG